MSRPPRLVIHGARVLLGGLLLLAALSKVTLFSSAQEFIVPKWGLAGIGLAEGIAGSLVVATDSRHALRAAFVLGVIFSLASILAMVAGTPLRGCGCFGALDVNFGVHLLFALTLMLLSAGCLHFEECDGLRSEA